MVILSPARRAFEVVKTPLKTGVFQFFIPDNLFIAASSCKGTARAPQRSNRALFNIFISSLYRRIKSLLNKFANSKAERHGKAGEDWIIK